MTELNLQNTGINKLDGLEEAKNLVTLRAGGNSISDLSPLKRVDQTEDSRFLGQYDRKYFTSKGIEKFAGIVFQNNQIEDLSPLEDLINLEYLNLEGNKIKHITSLQGLLI